MVRTITVLTLISLTVSQPASAVDIGGFISGTLGIQRDSGVGTLVDQGVGYLNKKKKKIEQKIKSEGKEAERERLRQELAAEEKAKMPAPVVKPVTAPVVEQKTMTDNEYEEFKQYQEFKKMKKK